MSLTTGPFPLTAGEAVQLTPPASAWSAVVITNLSPYLLAVQIGADSEWLNPWTEQAYPSPSSHAPIVATPSVIAGAAVGVAESQVNATWFAEGEKVSGSYPSALAGAAVQSVQGSATGIPVDVTTLGGGAFNSETVGPGDSVRLLGRRGSAIGSYRLQRWGFYWPSQFPSGTGGLLTLIANLTQLTTATSVVAAPENGYLGLSENLDGQLVFDLVVSQFTSESGIAWVTYDEVITPTIQ